MAGKTSAECSMRRVVLLEPFMLYYYHIQREEGSKTKDWFVPGIVAQILDVQTKSKIFGRVLKLPPHTVDRIHVQYSDPEKCLFQVMDEFVKQVEPRPTWRAIVNALKDPLIGLTSLAEEIEGKHCPAPPAQDGKSLFATGKDVNPRDALHHYK